MMRFPPWLVSAACIVASGAAGQAQPPSTPPVSAGTSTPTAAPSSVTTSKLSAADLEEMLAPIALYPDTLLATTLAACVYEDDVKAAAKFVAGGGKVDENTNNDWDPSVKVIAAFPEVINLLAGNPEWAVAVGQAYLIQGPEVMAAVQSLRARAWDNGNLKSTPQQTVVTEGKYIIIEPAKPDVIYVPTYNPSVVYVNNSANAAAAGVIGFGLGVATGLILANNLDCNWHGGCVGWGWGGGYHGNTNININHNTNINNNVNINGGYRPGQGGSQWTPNPSKVGASSTSGAALNNYKGVGSGSTSPANARIPGRTNGSQPIAATKAPSSPQPRPGNTARPAAPAPRPDSPGSAARPSTAPARPATPAAKPSAPAARPSTPAAKPSSPAPRPSGSNPSSGGSRSGGSGSRGGGGGRGR